MDGVDVRILDPKKEFALVLSVRSIIAGDVRAVESSALRRTKDNSVVSDYGIFFRDTDII